MSVLNLIQSSRAEIYSVMYWTRIRPNIQDIISSDFQTEFNGGCGGYISQTVRYQPQVSWSPPAHLCSWKGKERVWLPCLLTKSSKWRLEPQPFKRIRFSRMMSPQKATRREAGRSTPGFSLHPSSGRLCLSVDEHNWKPQVLQHKREGDLSPIPHRGDREVRERIQRQTPVCRLSLPYSSESILSESHLLWTIPGAFPLHIWLSFHSLKAGFRFFSRRFLST